MQPLRRLVPALIVAIAVIASCGSDDGPEVLRSYDVELRVDDSTDGDYGYVATTEIPEFKVGDEVTFIVDNTGQFPHDLQVQAPDGDIVGYADAVDPGEQLELTTFLGQVEWAWSPMHNAIHAHYLATRRDYWTVWVYWFDDNASPWRWRWWFQGWARRVKGVDERTAAFHLLTDLWCEQRDSMSYDHFHWINQEGIFDAAESHVGRPPDLAHFHPVGSIGKTISGKVIISNGIR